jgi:mono/diheme cytochrome c family protein
VLKKTGSVLIILFLLLTAVGFVMAEDAGNARKGKYLFRKNCRTCHGEGGSAKELSPISKTQAQWEEMFTSFDSLACSAEWQKLSEKDLADMHAHLWGHAYDSPSPAKCK